MKRIYFLGIGGIGMSALARYYRSLGTEVWGYDRVRSTLCQELEQEGCRIVYNEDENNIADLRRTDFDLVVLTPAIPRENKIFAYFRESGIPIKKRAEVLGIITRERRGLCVAGTHGKTTTSTMVAHLMREGGVDCSAFLGGISKNCGSNLMIARNDSDFVVIEADEFDRSFHHLTPYMAIVTATDADHLDIYGTHEAYLEAFAHFTSLIADNGALIVKEGVRLDRRVSENVRCYTYSMTGSTADFRAENIVIGNGRLTFDFVGPDIHIYNVELGVPVMVNVENAVAAMAMAWLNGVNAEGLKRGMQSFSGVKRRFDIKYNKNGRIHIDDYAHHPDELSRSIDSVCQLYQDRKIVVVFQPHLYTRTRDFYREFAASLSRADQVVILDIYPARELPIEGVTSEIIYNEVTSRVKCLTPYSELRNVLATLDWDVLLTVGAGDIGEFTLE